MKLISMVPAEGVSSPILGVQQRDLCTPDGFTQVRAGRLQNPAALLPSPRRAVGTIFLPAEHKLHYK